jgi:Phosphotransferase enzyme family/SnoaL-like domain
MASLEARVARLEAIEAVRATFNQYLYGLDTGNVADVLDSYGPDCVLDVLNFPPDGVDMHFDGRDAIAPLYAPYGKRTPMIAGGHNATNVAIDIAPDGRSAVLSSYFTTTRNVGVQGGRYEGVLHPHSDGRWRFATLSIISAWGWETDVRPVSQPVAVTRSRFAGRPATAMLRIPTSITDIDAAWLSQALATPVTSYATEQIGEGVGIMGQLWKVTPTYDAGNATGPTSVIVKLPSPFEENRAQGVALGMYEAEVRFYNELASETSTTTPRSYGGSIVPGTADFVLLLEDLSSMTMADEVAGMSLAQADAAVGALAALHRSWWGRTGAEDYAWLPTLDHPRIAAVSAVYPMLWEGFCAKFGDLLSAEARVHGDRIAASWGDLMAQLAKRPNTLLHMDFRCENMFFGTGSDVTVFDWQAIGRGPGVYDLAYLLGGSLPTEVRRAHESELLHAYHDALGVESYSYDEMYKDFCFATQVVTATPVFTGATLDLANARGKALIGGMGARLFASVVDHN